MPTKPSRSPSPAARSASPVARSLSPPVKGGGTPAKKTPAKSSGLPPVKAAGKPPVGGKRPPSAPKPGEFIASKKWDGPRTGMAFRNGPFGQGYYADDKVDNAATTTAGGAAHTPASAASSERELDAAEVFAMLPMSMQVAFEARDIAALDAALAALPPAEAEVHMSRCVASGLWDPGAGGDNASAAAEPTADQEPSPTGESDGPGSAGSSPKQQGSPEPPNASEEEAMAQAEARALEQRARQAQDAAAEPAEGAGAPTTGLFERGPYRNGGPQTDAPTNGSAQQAGKRPPIGKGKQPAAAAAKAGGAAATPAKAGGSSNASALQEQVASLQAQLQEEQRGRMHFEQENDKAQTALNRVRTKLDEAERFKSDEARAMHAAMAAQKRVEAENEKLKRLLQEHGIPLPASDGAGGSAEGKEGGGGGAGGGDLSGFDAAVKPSEEIAQISFPPASLDPDEVLQSLPASMQAAFDALDVAALHAALAALPPAEASEYMRRCVASGLWDPNGAGSAVDAS